MPDNERAEGQGVNDEPAGATERSTGGTATRGTVTTPAEPSAGHPSGPGSGGRSVTFVLLTMLLCGLTLTAGYLNKARCTGPSFDSQGRSEPDYSLRVARDVCYSDIQFLWIGRDIDRHVFPYVDGGIVGDQLYGGSVEYPVLTGMAIYVAALPSSTDAQFLAWSAVILAVAGLLSAALLAWLAGLRSWWFALAPPLVLYAFHNWDLLAVCATVVAFWALLRSGDAGAARRRLLVVAALALGIGGAFKLYPLMFVLPIGLWIGCGMIHRPNGRAGGGPTPPGLTPGSRWLGAFGFAAGTGAVFLLINLPFMIAGWRGWWASFQFQWSRPIDLTTNTIWFWATRPYSESGNADLQSELARLAAVTTLFALLLACGLGFLRLRRDGMYPWLPVCAAMVCGYLLFNKVHSPQFTLWLLPFFVLLRIRPGWIVAYFVADAAIGIGFFRWMYLLGTGAPSGMYDALAPQMVMIGVWGRAALLVALFVVFLRSDVVSRPARLRVAPDRPGVPDDPVVTPVTSARGWSP